MSQDGQQSGEAFRLALEDGSNIALQGVPVHAIQDTAVALTSVTGEGSLMTPNAFVIVTTERIYVICQIEGIVADTSLGKLRHVRTSAVRKMFSVKDHRVELFFFTENDGEISRMEIADPDASSDDGLFQGVLAGFMSYAEESPDASPAVKAHAKSLAAGEGIVHGQDGGRHLMEVSLDG